MTRSYDVIVIGLGGMGSATLWQLAKRGQRALGLEQFGVAHDRGSSHGLSRIIRLAYFEHPQYVPLLFRSYVLWRELEEFSNESLLFITGSIDAGMPSGALTTGSRISCQRHNLTHTLLSAKDLAEFYPGYLFPADAIAVFQPDGGYLIPELCITVAVDRAIKCGAHVQLSERVVKWERRGNDVVVTTDRDTYAAARLVVTTGPWASRLIPGLRPFLAVERQVMMWLQPLKPELFQPHNFPVFNMEVPEGRFYGFPSHRGVGFKIGKWHHRREQVDPDFLDTRCVPEDENVLRECVEKYFPLAAGQTLAMKTCMFTNTPDEQFVIDRLPGADQVCFAAGFSGHGFKFCSVVGEILADLATGRTLTHDISFLSLTRLGVVS